MRTPGKCAPRDDAAYDRSVRSVLGVLAITACGRFQFEDRSRADAGGNDASDALGDVPVDATPLGPFGAPVRLVELASISPEDDPTVTADGLEIIFNSSRPAPGYGNGDLWGATRSTTSMAFDTPILITELSTGFDETAPKMTEDGLTIYFGSDRRNLGKDLRDIFIATRPDRSSAWSAPTRIVELSTNLSEAAAMPSRDGLVMVFTTTRDGSTDLWHATRTSTTESWSDIRRIDELFDPVAEDGEPWLSPDGLVLFFASNRAGGQGMAIWQTSRTARDQPFAAPVLVSELDTASVDTDPWLSSDLRTIYFASDRGGVVDIYRATR
jgi:Tol biopolymer transport system component